MKYPSAISMTGGLLLWVGSVLPVIADSLSQLPAAFAERLVPIAEIDLDHLDSDSRQQLVSARSRVAQLMENRQTDSELADAWGELGALYHVKFAYTPAEHCYENALRLAPERFRWLYYSAYLADETGALNIAEQRYLKTRKIRPDYLAITARLGNVWLDLNEMEKAKQAFHEVAEARGLRAAAHFGLGQIALLERDHETAIGHFMTALEAQPDAGRIHYSLAQALRAVGENDRARQHLAQPGDRLPVIKDPQIESMQALKRGAHLHFVHGMQAMQKKDFTAARDAFASGLDREPENADARTSYARTLYLASEKQAAAGELKKVVEQDVSRALAWYLLGMLADERNDPHTAADHYLTALQHEPRHEGALFSLANNRYRQQLYAGAREYYATSIETAPDNMGVWLPYIGTLMHTGHERDRILGVVEAALQRFSGQPLFAYLRIQLLACDESHAVCDARRSLELAQAMQDQQPGFAVRELLALAHAATGDFKAALGLMEELIGEAMLVMPVEVGRLNRMVSVYRAEKLPAADILFTWKMLQPPPLNGIGAFRDYPTPKPY